MKGNMLQMVAWLLLSLAAAEACVPSPRGLREEMHTLERNLIEEEPKIFHEPLFPLQLTDWLGFSGATLGLILAAGGGIGGGGILVPIFILVLKFSPKHAIALSSCCVFGGAVANTILNVPKRHPLADRPLISWDLILVMEPPTIAGALLGVLANKALPDAVVVGMLVVVLSLTAWKTLGKAQKLYAQETLGWERVETNDNKNDVELAGVCVSDNMNDAKPTRGISLRRAQSDVCLELIDQQSCHQKKHRQNSWPSSQQDYDSSRQSSAPNERKASPGLQVQSSNSNSTEVVLLQFPPCGTSETKDDSSSHSTEDISFDCAVVDPPDRMLLARIVAEERHAPRKNVFIIVCFFLMVLVITILKGGGSFQSPVGIQCGSTSFWIAEVIVLCCIIAVSMYARSYLITRTKIKYELNYQYAEGDIRWDGRATCMYPSASILAGFFAGMFGIGGGIIKGPLMLAMGVLPAVASATSACMILFTSFTATASYMVFGLVIPDYAWFCFGMGFFATVIGQLAMSHLLRRYQRNSYIAFCIGTVVLLSAIFMTVESIVAIKNKAFHSSAGICSSS